MLELQERQRRAKRAPALSSAGDFEVPDGEMIDRILKGEPCAREAFVRRYGRLIHHILNRMRFPPQEVEDLYQQVFVHLWEQDCKRLRQWRGRGKFSSYLGVVVTRLACGAKRLQPAPAATETGAAGEGESASQLDLADPGPGLEALILQNERRAAIWSALGQLSARDRELIGRRHEQEQSYREIALALDITVNHVGVALAQAERRLRGALRRSYPGLFE